MLSILLPLATLTCTLTAYHDYFLFGQRLSLPYREERKADISCGVDLGRADLSQIGGFTFLRLITPEPCRISFYRYEGFGEWKVDQGLTDLFSGRLRLVLQAASHVSDQNFWTQYVGLEGLDQFDAADFAEIQGVLSGSRWELSEAEIQNHLKERGATYTNLWDVFNNGVRREGEVSLIRPYVFPANERVRAVLRECRGEISRDSEMLPIGEEFRFPKHWLTIPE